MLATPLVAALRKSYPQARFDWAVSDWARPALLSNGDVKELISTGAGRLNDLKIPELRAFIHQLRQEKYDTCFIPSRSSLLSLVAWQAHIPQRIGLHVNGRGFAHTIAVTPPDEVQHVARQNLLLAQAVGVDSEIIDNVEMVFTPPDRDRTIVTRRLVERVDWLGATPLVIMHPGGGENPVQTAVLKRWPIERFAVLGNYLIQKHAACIVLIGAANERLLADGIAGLMSGKVTNLAGEMSLGEVAAMCEVADLYVGNDAGPTHVAAATGCPTLAIFGPSNPALSKPYTRKGKVITLWRENQEIEQERPFTWEIGVSASEAIEAAELLLAPVNKSESSFPFLVTPSE